MSFHRKAFITKCLSVSEKYNNKSLRICNINQDYEFVIVISKDFLIVYVLFQAQKIFTKRSRSSYRPSSSWDAMKIRYLYEDFHDVEPIPAIFDT